MPLINHNSVLSQERLCELFEYRGGDLYWKVNRSNIKSGTRAGCPHINSGYSVLRVDGKLYGLHRIVFMLIKGYLPKLVDHIDGDKSNNRIENLRDATHSQNLQNQRILKCNTSGIKGVSWSKRERRWRAEIRAHGKRLCLGYFKDLNEANVVIRAAREKLHGEYANHG